MEASPNQEIKRSALTFFSLGLVATNVTSFSKEIEVVPIESITLIDGAVTENVETQEVVGHDASGKEYRARANTSLAIPATWWPGPEANRLTVPDLRRGEIVEIHRMGETEDYYWCTTGYNNSKLRTVETLIYYVKATNKEDQEAVPENIYALELSSHNKTASLWTSRDNSEECAWMLQLSGASGKAVLTDDDGNLLMIDNLAAQVRLENKEDTSFEIIGKDSNWVVPEKISIESQILTSQQKALIEFFVAKSIGFKITPGGIVVDGGAQIKETAATRIITAATIHNGGVAINGTLTSLDASGGGDEPLKVDTSVQLLPDRDMEIGGELLVEKDIESKQDVKGWSQKYDEKMSMEELWGKVMHP